MDSVVGWGGPHPRAALQPRVGGLPWSDLPASATRWLSSADSSHPRATEGREDSNIKGEMSHIHDVSAPYGGGC